MRIVEKRVERIWLKPSDELNRMCHIAKNLYNEAIYLIRQELFNTGKWIRYNELARMLKDSENYKILSAKTGQQILRYVDCNWKAFFNAMKHYKKTPTVFTERPRIPKYKHKDGIFMLIFTNQQVSIKNNVLVFPKKMKKVLPEVKVRPVIKKLREVRLIPRAVGYVLEIVYDKIINAPERDKCVIAGIDLGVRNLATIVDNTGNKPVVVKGGAVKSIIQFYQKENARLQSIYDLQEQKKQGMQMRRLSDKYEKKMHDYLHKVSNTIIQHLNSHGIGLLVIGYNDDWQRYSNIGRQNNQTFSSIPYNKLINMMQYKAEEHGIKVIIREESHTSKCSFFDNESIGHHDKYVGKRKGGLFRTAKGYIVNADVNGGFDIVKKAVPNAFQKWIADGIEDAVGHPLRLEVMR